MSLSIGDPGAEMYHWNGSCALCTASQGPIEGNWDPGPVPWTLCYEELLQLITAGPYEAEKGWVLEYTKRYVYPTHE